MMPFRVAIPNNVMNPIVVATLRIPPDRNPPATPPMSGERIPLGKYALRGGCAHTYA
jgi:hypothetical protein